jgi:hypothetical protein
VERTLDRREQFDERSRDYPIREVIRRTGLKTRDWACPVVLDQGTEGACVGFGWAHELAARPHGVPVTDGTAQVIYNAAQHVDPWPGCDYSGTSMLAGAKVVKDLGFVPEYRWAFGIDDVCVTLSRYGPVVLGLAWYEGMADPDHLGRLRPTGSVIGGHCLTAVGIEVTRGDEPWIRVLNSWGADWGENGRAWFTASDLEALLAQQGEACVPVKRRRFTA